MSLIKLLPSDGVRAGCHPVNDTAPSSVIKGRRVVSPVTATPANFAGFSTNERETDPGVCCFVGGIWVFNAIIPFRTTGIAEQLKNSNKNGAVRG